jgi:hypothetical protein
MKIGERFGKLMVLDVLGGRKSLFKCDCGNEKMIHRYDVLKGKTTSCGCLRKEKQNAEKHGLSNHKTYVIFKEMKQRCYNPKNKDYKNYGLRDIKICDEWLSNFLNFYNWSIDNGWQDGKSIDRIDNDKGYYPENCRWVDMKIQANNHRRNSIIKYRGEERTLQEWSDLIGIDRNTIKTRLNLGWTVEDSFEIKPMKGRNQYK